MYPPQNIGIGGIVNTYHLDDGAITLDDLRKRLETTDLIPSRVSLLEGIHEHFARLRDSGILTLADLREAVKSKKALQVLSVKTGIEREYLTLLRREIEGYFPKPLPVASFNWIPQQVLIAFKNNGMADTKAIVEQLSEKRHRTAFGLTAGIAPVLVETVFCLSGLTRIQWTSPAVARMLLAAGYRTVAQVASADPDMLYRDLDRVNREQKIFKGTIGSRDVRRLIRAAKTLVQLPQSA